MPRWEPSIFLPAKNFKGFHFQILESWSKPKAPNPPHFAVSRRQKRWSKRAQATDATGTLGNHEVTLYPTKTKKMAEQFLAGVPSELTTGRAPKQMHEWRHYVSVGRR